MSRRRSQRSREQKAGESSSSQSQLAHWFEGDVPWEAGLDLSNANTTSLSRGRGTQNRQGEAYRSGGESKSKTATSMENNSGTTRHNPLSTQVERDFMGESDTIAPYEQTVQPSWAASMTMAPGGQRREDELDEEQRQDMNGEAEGLPTQELRDVIFNSVSILAVPLSLIPQACAIASQSSHVLTEEQYQAFEGQPPKVRQESIRIFLAELAARGPDFGVARRLSQEELDNSDTEDEKKDDEVGREKTGDEDQDQAPRLKRVV